MDERRNALILLAHVPWLRQSHLDALRPDFGEPEDIVKANPDKIRRCEAVGEALRAELAGAIANTGADEARSKLDEKDIHAVTILDDEYPRRLAETYAPPIVLFCKGDASLLDRLSIAVVGSRKSSNYGASQAEKFSADLAELGIVIVSGMALGIDAAGHQGALSVRGKTIAVLGCGANVIYPQEHHELYSRIVLEGCVVSEYPPDMEPKAPHFPERNRIISGLSHGVFVAEAPLKSGALITARLAIEQGREVFALPGMITSPSSRGCNGLVKNGQAALVESADDIVIALKLDKRSLLYGTAAAAAGQTDLFDGETAEINAAPVKVVDKSGYTAAALGPDELDILEKVSYEGTHINDIARATNLSIAELSARLTMLEIKGVVTTTSGGFYQRI